jgi:hypothetical protein
VPLAVPPLALVFRAQDAHQLALTVECARPVLARVHAVAVAVVLVAQRAAAGQPYQVAELLAPRPVPAYSAQKKSLCHFIPPGPKAFTADVIQQPSRIVRHLSSISALPEAVAEGALVLGPLPADQRAVAVHLVLHPLPLVPAARRPHALASTSIRQRMQRRYVGIGRGLTTPKPCRQPSHFGSLCAP